MTLSNLWQIITNLPLGTLGALLGIATSILGVAGLIGFYINKLVHAHELVELKNEISKLENEVHKLKEAPRVTVSLKSTEESLSRVASFLRNSFTREPYIHPRIIEALSGWLADSNPDIASINLEAAMRSNKYTGPVEIKKVNFDTWITSSDNQERTMFSYRYLGVSPAGIHALLTAENGAGSGTFYNVLFLIFQLDNYLDYSAEVFKKDRVLLKCIGRVILGDRYDGQITFVDGKLSIGERRNFFPEYQLEPRILIVD